MLLNEKDVYELIAEARANYPGPGRVRIEIGFLYCRVEHLFYDPTVAESDYPVGLLLQGYVGQYADYTQPWTVEHDEPGGIQFYDPTVADVCR